MLRKLFSLSALGLAAATECGTCWEPDTVNGGCKPQAGLMDLNCSGSSMVLTVHTCVMGNTNLSLLQLVDNGASEHCTMSVAPTGITEELNTDFPYAADTVTNVYVATVTLDCSGRVIIPADTSVDPAVPEKIKFDQTLSARLPDDAGDSIISFSNTNSVGFSCAFPTDYEISDDYEVEASITASQAVDQDAKFEFSIGWYNSDWVTPAAVGAVSVGSTGHVGVSVAALPTGFEFTTHTCTIDHITGTGEDAVATAGLTHKILDNKVPDTLTSAAVVTAYSTTMTKLTFRVFEFRGSTGNQMRMTCNIRVCATDAAENFCRAPAASAVADGPAANWSGRSFIVRTDQNAVNEEWDNQVYHERMGSDINGLAYYVTSYLGRDSAMVHYNNPVRGTFTDWNENRGMYMGQTQINGEGDRCPTWTFRERAPDDRTSSNYDDGIGLPLELFNYYSNWATSMPASECGSIDPEAPSSPLELDWKNYETDYAALNADLGTSYIVRNQHNPTMNRNTQVLEFNIDNAILPGGQYTSTHKGKNYYVSFHKTKPYARAVEFCERLNLKIARFDIAPVEIVDDVPVPNADDKAEFDEVALHFKNFFAGEYHDDYGTRNHNWHGNGNMWISGSRERGPGASRPMLHEDGSEVQGLLFNSNTDANWCHRYHNHVDGVILEALQGSSAAGNMRCDRSDTRPHTVLCMDP